MVSFPAIAIKLTGWWEPCQSATVWMHPHNPGKRLKQKDSPIHTSVNGGIYRFVRQLHLLYHEKHRCAGIFLSSRFLVTSLPALVFSRWFDYFAFPWLFPPVPPLSPPSCAFKSKFSRCSVSSRLRSGVNCLCLLACLYVSFEVDFIFWFSFAFPVLSYCFSFVSGLCWSGSHDDTNCTKWQLQKGDSPCSSRTASLFLHIDSQSLWNSSKQLLEVMQLQVQGKTQADVNLCWLMHTVAKMHWHELRVFQLEQKTTISNFYEFTS